MKNLKSKKELRESYGTPSQFEKAIWKAWEDLFITSSEAKAAIDNYNQEYKEAKAMKPTKYRTHVTMTIERDGKEIEVEIEGYYYPGRMGDRDNPREYPEVEVINACITEGLRYYIDLTDKEHDRAVELLIEEAEKEIGLI